MFRATQKRAVWNKCLFNFKGDWIRILDLLRDQKKRLSRYRSGSSGSGTSETFIYCKHIRKISYYIQFLFFLSIFYYPIHVKTAEPIWSNFFCGNSHDPGEAVYVDIYYFWKFANSNGKIRKNVRRWPLSKQKLKVEIPKKNCAVCTLYVLYGNIAKAKSFWTITDFFVGLNLLPLARNRVISKGLLHTLLLIVIQP